MEPRRGDRRGHPPQAGVRPAGGRAVGQRARAGRGRAQRAVRAALPRLPARRPRGARRVGRVQDPARREVTGPPGLRPDQGLGATAADGACRGVGGRDGLARCRDPRCSGVDGCKAGWVGALLTGLDVRRAGGRRHRLARDHRAARGAGAHRRRHRHPDRVAGRPRPCDRRPRSHAAAGRPEVVGLPDALAGGGRGTPRTRRRPQPTARRSAWASACRRSTWCRRSSTSTRSSAAARRCRCWRCIPRSASPRSTRGCVVPSKATAPGAAARRAALRSVGLEPPAYVRGQGYAADDLLDACVVAWTAARYAAGTAYSLPDPPEVFSDGIAAAIWV